MCRVMSLNIVLLRGAGSKAGDAAALKVHVSGFGSKLLSQSSSWPGANNTLILRFSVTTRVLHDLNASLTITGLVGSRSEDGRLEVSGAGDGEQPFEASAQWSKRAGKLVFILLRDLEPGRMYSASFRLLNPYTGQDSPGNIRIRYSSRAQPFYGVRFTSHVASDFALVAETLADVGQGSDAVLKVDEPRFLQRTMLQTSTAPGARNNITLILQTNFELSSKHNSRVTVLGLNVDSEPAAGEKEHLVLAGGFSQTEFHKDVYVSYDGLAWHLLAAAAPWMAREGHELLNAQVQGRHALLVIGGRSVSSSNEMVYLNDVWRFHDGGSEWTQVPFQVPLAA